MYKVQEFKRWNGQVVWFVILGNQQITEAYTTKDEADKACEHYNKQFAIYKIA